MKPDTLNTWQTILFLNWKGGGPLFFGRDLNYFLVLSDANIWMAAQNPHEKMADLNCNKMRMAPAEQSQYGLFPTTSISSRNRNVPIRKSH